MSQSLILDVRYYDKGHSFSAHQHGEHELIYIANGITAMTINGKKQIVDRNRLVFLSSEDVHSGDVLTSGFEQYSLMLSPPLLDPFIKDTKLTSIFRNRPAGFEPVVHAPSFTHELLRKLYAEHRGGEDYAGDMMCAYLREILIRLYRQDKRAFPVLRMQNKREIFAVQGYIDQNFRDNINITEIAERFYMSSYYLSHAFHKLVGMSPRQYLTHVRLEHAKTLLNETPMSVQEVAQNSGFPDVNAFIRSFRQIMGLTPGQYRNMREDK